MDNGQILLSGPLEPIDMHFNCNNYYGYKIKGFKMIIDDDEFYLSKDDVKNLLSEYKKVKDE